MVNILVSSCLLGENCKWNGKNNLKEKVLALKTQYNLIPICPEVMSGMPTPRIPSERIDKKVVNQINLDVTKKFELGAKKTLEVALTNNCRYAILKDHSPSCGVNLIYDGSFSRTLKEGKGFTTEFLQKHGIKVFSEDQIDELLKEFEDR